MYISDEDYCLEVNNITKTKTENKTIRTCYRVDTDKHSTNRDHGFIVNLYILHNRRTPLQAEEAPISIPRGSRGVGPF
jgi:hypothetical protein